MTIYYMDTSAIAKRYIPEVGSAWVGNLTTPFGGNVIVICELTPVEFFSALERRQRSGTISSADVLTLQNGFLSHYRHEYLSVELHSGVMMGARNLTKFYPLRALDAIQLAAALEFINTFPEPVTFVSADNNLLTAASGEGFATDNPLNYQ